MDSSLAWYRFQIKDIYKCVSLQNHVLKLNNKQHRFSILYEQLKRLWIKKMIKDDLNTSLLFFSLFWYWRIAMLQWNNAAYFKKSKWVYFKENLSCCCIKLLILSLILKRNRCKRDLCNFTTMWCLRYVKLKHQTNQQGVLTQLHQNIQTY